MKINLYKSAAAIAFVLCVGATSCTGDMDVDPINPQVEQTPDDDAIFNKIYSSFILTGQTGNAGSPDIPTSVMEDEGNTNYFRMLWYLNEITSDEAAWRWSGNDGGVSELQHDTYTSSNAYSFAFYYRAYFTITLCNYYLNSVGSDAARLAEVRFIRAYCYASILDIYGGGPFCTAISAENAPYYDRKQMFDFVEEELLASEEDLAEPGQNSYGRVDKAAARLMLARLYLNAEVYTGTARWSDAQTYADKVINGGYYELNTTGVKNTDGTWKYTPYQMLFLADNDATSARKENIFVGMHDGIKTIASGGMQFLILGSYCSDATLNASVDPGVDAGKTWGTGMDKCIQVKGKLVDQFFNGTTNADDVPYTSDLSQMIKAAGDDRALLYSKGLKKNLEVEDNVDYTFICVKFRNVRSDGGATASRSDVDTDLPLLRLAEAYLIKAEAAYRINKGPNTTTDAAIKVLRDRAHAVEMKNITEGQIMSEWSREFWFEGNRRTTLIRFGKFAGQSDYTWEFMGGAASGTKFASYRNLFALPQQDLTNNPNLKQNEGY